MNSTSRCVTGKCGCCGSAALVTTTSAFVGQPEKSSANVLWARDRKPRTFLKRMRVMSSAKMTRSRMMGAASRLSSHVLCMTMVLRPPMKISLVYSSMARLLSATYGTYLMTTTWSGCSPGPYRMEFESTCRMVGYVKR